MPDKKKGNNSYIFHIFITLFLLIAITFNILFIRNTLINTKKKTCTSHCDCNIKDKNYCYFGKCGQNSDILNSHLGYIWIGAINAFIAIILFLVHHSIYWKNESIIANPWFWLIVTYILFTIIIIFIIFYFSGLKKGTKNEKLQALNVLEQKIIKNRKDVKNS